MELDCDWLEEVVAALSWEKPLWLDFRLVIELLREERERDGGEEREMAGRRERDGGEERERWRRERVGGEKRESE